MQRVKQASFLANIALKTKTNSSCFEDEKHQAASAARNVGGLRGASLERNCVAASVRSVTR